MIAIAAGIAPILIGLPRVLVAAATGVIPFEAATYMIAPMGLRVATKAGRWLTEVTEMAATMTAMAARLPAILRARRRCRGLMPGCSASRATGPVSPAGIPAVSAASSA